jgi:hypothetical protein
LDNTFKAINASQVQNPQNQTKLSLNGQIPPTPGRERWRPGEIDGGRDRKMQDAQKMEYTCKIYLNWGKI